MVWGLKYLDLLSSSTAINLKRFYYILKMLNEDLIKNVKLITFERLSEKRQSYKNTNLIA